MELCDLMSMIVMIGVPHDSIIDYCNRIIIKCGIVIRDTYYDMMMIRWAF